MDAAPRRRAALGAGQRASGASDVVIVVVIVIVIVVVERVERVGVCGAARVMTCKTWTENIHSKRHTAPRTRATESRWA
jgi:hypothetical protein